MRTLLTIVAISLIIVAGAAEAAGPVASPPPGRDEFRQITPEGNNTSMSGMSDGDIEALAFLVLMQAAKSAQEDLKAVMAHVKAINNNKQQQRKSMQEAQSLGAGAASHRPCETPAALIDCLHLVDTKVTKMKLATLDLMRASVMLTQANAALLRDSLRHAPEEFDRVRRNQRPPARIIPANPCRGWNITFWKQCTAAMKLELAGSASDARGQAEVDLLLDKLGQTFDSMSEAQTMEHLQTAMNRMDKLTAALTNLLKKISETANAITQNLK